MQLHRFSRCGVLVIPLSTGGADRLVHGLQERGLVVTSALSFEHAVAEVAAREYPVVLLHLAGSRRERNLAHPSFLDTRDQPAFQQDLHILERIRSLSPASQVVVLVAEGTDLTTCCRAVTLGAASFVYWHEEQDLAPVVDRLLQALARYEAAVEEGRELHSQKLFDEAGIAGKSQLMAKLLFQAKRAALISDAPVLVTGESGTGKQLLAEAIHRMDPKRRQKPFVTVNCAAITGTLAESALFGHRKGAFTGATENRLGYFRTADGGTILLDEISELDKTLQPKLLRVLQESRVMPVGGDVEDEIDVRVIAATNRPLPIMVETRDFRLDLYQRLNVIALEIPPLRDRPEDVPLLVNFFLQRYASYYPQGVESVDPQVYEVLARTVGSGNVRELENAVRQILAFKAAGTRLELADIPHHLLSRQVESVRRESRQEADLAQALTSAAVALTQSNQVDLAEVIEEFEAIILREALTRCKSTHTDLAQRLGLSRRTFYNKIRKYNLPLSDQAAGPHGA